MKIILILLIGFLPAVMAGTYAQEKKLTISVQNENLENVLREIEKQSEFLFFYHSDEIDKNKKLTVNRENSTVYEILDDISGKIDISYIVKDRHIVLTKHKKEANLELEKTYQSNPNLKTVTGVVTDSSGEPIIGASVQLKRATTGTITNIDGAFSINVEPGNTLVVSYMGYIAKEVVIGAANVYNITLVEDAKLLDEVVVTAMGIKKERKALGYAVQDVNAGELMKNKTANVVNSLAGKVAGVSITQSGGAAGAGASIIIRGGTSLERDNQPLFVVDGIIYDNSTNIGGSSGFDGAQSINSTYSNRVMDINPEDVENMSVLKGPAAAALYGSRAAAGVIIITTKKGGEGQVQVNVNSKVTASWANRVPEQQKIYKRGTNDNQGNIITTGVLSSWGEKITASDKIYDNIGEFFQTGWIFDNNVSISGGNQNTNYYLSVSRFDQEGIIPETGYVKNTFRFNGEQKYGKVTVGTNIAYSVADTDKALTSAGLYGSGGTGSMNSVYRWPLTEDMTHWLNSDGTKYRMFEDQLLANDVDNPYWIVNKNTIGDKTTRFTGNIKANIDLFDWWKITYTGGTDRYTTDTDRLIYPGSGVGLILQKGSLSKNKYTYEYLTSNIMMSFNKKISDFDLNLLVGQSVEDTRTEYIGRRGWNFVVDNFFSINNTDDMDRAQTESNSRRRLIGVYGEFRASYKSIAYLTVTGRNDWSSTLPTDSRSYFYPSVSGSLVFSELLPENTVLSFGKVRASWARVGKDADPYVTNTYLNAPIKTLGGSGLMNSWTQGNPYLIPEKTESTEYGLEMRFLNGRIGFDFTYYENRSINQLLSPRTSEAGGYIFMTTNAANITNKGMELAISGTPIRNKDFTWETTLNLSGNRGKVHDLLPGLEVLYVTDTQVGNAKSASFNNGDFMGIAGTEWQRDDKGNVILNEKSGMPLTSTSSNQHVGNREPKLLGGFNNTFNYKNWSLSFLLDFRIGGDIYNGTEYFMTGQGLSLKSANREKLTINGVVQTGTDENKNPVYSPATYNFDANKFYNKDDFREEVGADDPNRYSGKSIINGYWTSTYAVESANYITKTNWLRLRAVSLSYSMPKSLLAKTKVLKGLTATLTGTNLWVLTNYKGLDPEVSAAGSGAIGSSSVGIDYCGVPSTAGVSFGLNITF